MLVDLETNQVVDLLPDRESATLAAWLSSNPGAQIIARDRAGSYAKGAREGAPLARQVANRWHMLRNCSDALVAAVEKRYKLVREVGWSLANDVAPVGPLERPATIGMSSAALDHFPLTSVRRVKPSRLRSISFDGRPSMAVDASGLEAVHQSSNEIPLEVSQYLRPGPGTVTAAPARAAIWENSAAM